MSMPVRPYPDWHRLVPGRFRQEICRSPDDWCFCYNIDWASFLFYCNILHHKDYRVEGGLPHWLEAYVGRMEVVPFCCNGQDITLVFHKARWVTNTLTFHLADRVTDTGTVYNVTSRIAPSPQFLAGEPAPGRGACPQSVWEPYLIAYCKHHFNGDSWGPGM